jgi:hypothetical protein
LSGVFGFERVVANKANTKAPASCCDLVRSNLVPPLKACFERMRKLLWCLWSISSGYASETVFSIHDDVLAYPQVNLRLPIITVHGSSAMHSMR